MKAQLLRLMKNEDREKAVDAVLQSGLLPEPQLQQFLDNLTKRAIHRTLDKSGCQAWDTWAINWLSGEDRTEEAVQVARDAARVARDAARDILRPIPRRVAHAVSQAAVEAVCAAACTVAHTDSIDASRSTSLCAAACAVAHTASIAASRSAPWAVTRTEERVAWVTEYKRQYQDLLTLINEMKDENN
jgi:hypothetical protein